MSQVPKTVVRLSALQNQIVSALSERTGVVHAALASVHIPLSAVVSPLCYWWTVMLASLPQQQTGVRLQAQADLGVGGGAVPQGAMAQLPQVPGQDPRRGLGRRVPAAVLVSLEPTCLRICSMAAL